MMEIQRRRETEEAWEEARAARNLKAAHEGRFEEGRENTGNGRKRNVSSNISPPNMRKAPRMKGSPPSSSIQSTSSNQNTQRRPPIQSSGAPLPRGDAHPVQPYIAVPQPHPLKEQQEDSCTLVQPQASRVLATTTLITTTEFQSMQDRELKTTIKDFRLAGSGDSIFTCKR